MSENSDRQDTELQQWVDQVHHGDSVELLKQLPDESIHAVVSDPPYGIAFMSTGWDEFDSPKDFQEWAETWASECLRVLKPGGHLIAFGGDRSFHRLQSGVEDAGFEIRPMNAWLHGQGFPKGLDVSKAIDKHLGKANERPVVGHEDPRSRYDSADRGDYGEPYEGLGDGSGTGGLKDKDGSSVDVTEAATPEAAAYSGHSTAQKPAIEPITVARKPLEGTVAENVLEHGTGALNIDGCRIPTDEQLTYGSETHESGKLRTPKSGARMEQHEQGRYPPNVILSPESEQLLDQQSGELENQYRPNSDKDGSRIESPVFGGFDSNNKHGYNDEGGASRFYYTAKAASSERTLGGRVENDHPTVKSINLLSWLVKLVTRDDQVVLDPFLGSGTTALVCELRGQPWIGIDSDPDSVSIARNRLDSLEEWIAEDDPEIDMLESEIGSKKREYQGQQSLNQFGTATDGGMDE